MQKKKQREVHTGLGGHSWAVSWLLFSRLVTSGSSGRCSFSSFSLGKPGKLYCIYILYQRLVHRMCPWVRKLNLSQRQLPMAPRKPRCRNGRTTTWVPEVPHHGTMVKHLLRKKTKTRLLQASCHRIQRCRSATFWWFQLYIYIYYSCHLFNMFVCSCVLSTIKMGWWYPMTPLFFRWVETTNQANVSMVWQTNWGCNYIICTVCVIYIYIIYILYTVYYYYCYYYVYHYY
jgi:hypothetical protein